MFSVAFMYCIIWVFTVKRASWNGKKLWKRKVVPMGDLKPQIVGHMIFSLKSPSYCPIVMGIEKVEKLINGEHIKRKITQKTLFYLFYIIDLMLFFSWVVLFTFIEKT